MPKVIVQIYPSLGGHDAMRGRRPIGRDADAFHSVMGGLREIAEAMDELGYWGLSHVEHHFHSEGLELSPDPGLWNLYLGGATRRLRHGQLGYVLPARDPLRLAESIAMIDHMLEGRLFVGVARGYQQRWMNVLGQRSGVRAGTPEDEEARERTRELYFEHFRLLKLAWEKDLLQYRSRHYEVPYPYEEGIPGWPPADTLTRDYGAPGEVDEEGTLQGVSVVPRCYQDPHPPIFQPFTHTPDTVRWAGREGLIPITMAAPMPVARRFAELYRHEAAIGGRELELGQSMGMLRAFSIHATRTEMHEAIERHDMLAWRDWYGAFGHLEAFRRPGEEGPIPAPGESVAERLLDVGMILGGTVEEVKRSLERQLREVPFEYLVWHLPYAAIPKDEALQQLELFATQVMPDLGFEGPETPPARVPSAAADQAGGAGG